MSPPSPEATDPPPLPRAALIGLDWGTTNLRAFLFDASGRLLDQRGGGPGVMGVADQAFRAAFEGLCAPWLAHHPDLPVIAGGMIGSRQGWREASYLATPAGFAEIAAGLTHLDDLAQRMFRVVPGIRAIREDGSSDVMRGEEVQVMGAAGVAHRDEALFTLPGTHGKWVRMREGRIHDLRTYLGGETWAVLGEHSILGRLFAPIPIDEADEGIDSRAIAAAGTASAAMHAATRAALDEAFALGVRQAAAQPGALLHLLFMVRTEGLFSRLKPWQLPEYLSGLLIGAELADALAWAPAQAVPTLIADPAAAARYQRALGLLGRQARIADPQCTPRGLYAVAAAAGLLR